MSREALIERTTAATTYTAAGGSVIGGLSANDIALYGGLIVAVITACVNWWYRHQHLKIARQVAAEKPDCAVCPDRKGDE